MTPLDSDMANGTPSLLLVPENNSNSHDNYDNYVTEAVMPSKVMILGMDFDNFTKQELLSNLKKGVIDLFLKRNYQKNKKYSSNVIPFPYFMFVKPCILWSICKVKNYDNNFSEKVNGIFCVPWCRLAADGLLRFPAEAALTAQGRPGPDLFAFVRQKISRDI
jgi:hypothetical protein